MWNDGKGFMAIWSDVAPGDTEFYHDWLLKEHFEERVRVPGFIAARVFRREVGEDLQFFIVYETEGPHVLASAAYVERLNNPTAKTQAVMPKLKNFVRGTGLCVETHGLCGGGIAHVRRFETAPARLSDPAARAALCARIAAMDRVLAVRLFEVDSGATTIQTAEKKMRTSKETIYSHLLIVEAASAEALAPAMQVLDEVLAGDDESAPFVATYQFMAELQSRSLR